MQLEFFDVPSPCVGICQSDEKGYCLGCMRTRNERQNWQVLDSDKRQKVIKLCIQRKKRKDKKIKTNALENKKELNLDATQQNDASQQPSLLDPPRKPQLDQSDDLDFGDFEL